jgi:secondary thiamine-phosphate synthase enzyme
MRIHNDYITLHTATKREFVDITPNVKDAMDKSGIRNGLILVSALHSNSGVIVNDVDSGLLEDIGEWADKLAPNATTYHHNPRAESNASAHLQSVLLNHQTIVGITDGKLELGPWQQVIYAELDGMRPKRILVKVLGE